VRAPVQHARAQINPAADRVFAPLQSQHRRVARAGIDAEQNEASDVTIDAAMVALDLALLDIPAECCTEQLGCFRARQVLLAWLG